MIKLRKLYRLDKIIDSKDELGLNTSFQFEDQMPWGKAHLLNHHKGTASDLGRINDYSQNAMLQGRKGKQLKSMAAKNLSTINRFTSINYRESNSGNKDDSSTRETAKSRRNPVASQTITKQQQYFSTLQKPLSPGSNAKNQKQAVDFRSANNSALHHLPKWQQNQHIEIGTVEMGKHSPQTKFQRIMSPQTLGSTPHELCLQQSTPVSSNLQLNLNRLKNKYQGEGAGYDNLSDFEKELTKSVESGQSPKIRVLPPVMPGGIAYSKRVVDKSRKPDPYFKALKRESILSMDSFNGKDCSFQRLCIVGQSAERVNTLSNEEMVETKLPFILQDKSVNIRNYNLKKEGSKKGRYTLRKILKDINQTSIEKNQPILQNADMLQHFFSNDAVESSSSVDGGESFRKKSRNSRDGMAFSQGRGSPKRLGSPSKSIHSKRGRKGSSPMRRDSSPIRARQSGSIRCTSPDQTTARDDDPEMCIIHKQKRASYLVSTDINVKQYNEDFLKRKILSSFDKRFRSPSKKKSGDPPAGNGKKSKSRRRADESASRTQQISQYGQKLPSPSSVTRPKMDRSPKLKKKTKKLNLKFFQQSQQNPLAPMFLSRIEPVLGRPMIPGGEVQRQYFEEVENSNKNMINKNNIVMRSLAKQSVVSPGKRNNLFSVMQNPMAPSSVIERGSPRKIGKISISIEF